MTIVCSMTTELLEENADTIKALVVAGLVKEGLLDFDKADKWCESHGIVLAKKSIFRTVSNLWKNQKTKEGLNYRLVKTI